MNQERYNVVFYGEIQEGHAVDEVKQRMISMFGLTREYLEQVFAGQPLMIKEQVSYEDALKYKTAFERAGTICQLEPTHGQRNLEPQQTGAKNSSAQKGLYHVIFSGEIAAGQDPQQVKHHLEQLFKTDRDQIDKLFIGKPVRIRENVPYQTAVQYQTALERAGAICSIQSVEKQAAQKKSEQPGPAKAQRPSLAAKKKRPDLKPSPDTDINALLDHYRSQVKNRDVLRLASRIPTELLVLANKTYAYAFNRHTEKSFAVLDLISLGYGLLFTEKRVYVYEKPHKPLIFKLGNLQSIEIRNAKLYINEQEVMSIPPEAREDMPVLVNLIREIASFYPQQAEKTEEMTSAPVHSEDPSSASSGGKKWIFAVATVCIILTAAMVGYFQLRGPSLPQEALIKTLVKEFVRDDRITLNLVSIGQIGEYDPDQNSIPVQVSVSGQCEDIVLLKDLDLELATNDDGQWSIVSPQHFAFEYQLCPISDEEISQILDAEMEKELQYIRRAYTKENKGLVVPINALMLEIGIKAPALKQITVKYKDIYSQKIDGVETSFAYQKFSDVEIFLSRDQAGVWNIGGMDTLKKLDKTIQDSIKRLEDLAAGMKR